MDLQASVSVREPTDCVRSSSVRSHDINRHLSSLANIYRNLHNSINMSGGVPRIRFRGYGLTTETESKEQKQIAERKLEKRQKAKQWGWNNNGQKCKHLAVVDMTQSKKSKTTA